VTQLRRLATIVAIDVAGYSARTEADEAKTTAEVAALHGVIDGIALAHQGRVFNTAGDGFMLEFTSSLAAVEAATELAEKCSPPVRVGVHLGDVVVQPNGDLLGHGVNVAARLMAKSDPGGVLVSADVRRTIRGPIAERLVSRGPLHLDKMSETIEAFALPGRAPATAAQPARRTTSGAAAWRSRMVLDVMPFLDMTAARDQALFVEGVHDETIAALTRTGAVTAVAAKSESEAKAPFRLEGRIRGSSTRLRVTLSLIVTETGTHCWTESFDGSADAALDFQEQIAKATAFAVENAMLIAETERALTLSPEARGPYELYLMAAFLCVRWERTAIEEALKHIDEALRTDPDFPQVNAVASFCHSMLFQTGWTSDPAETKRRGMELARRALNAADRNILVLMFYTAAEVSWGEDVSASDAIIERSLMRVPNDVRLLAVQGWIKLVGGGRPGEALKSLEAAQAGDMWAPFLPFILFGRAISQLLLHHHDAAIPLMRETLALRPQYLFAQVLLISALGHAGRHEEARLAAGEIANRAHVPHILTIFRNAGERAHIRRGLELAGLTVDP